jgi:hypothetical protein
MINSNKEQQWLKPSNVLFKTTCSKRLQLMGTNCTDTRSDLSLIREEVFQQIGSPPIVQDNSRFWNDLCKKIKI